ncbi:MAG: flagellar hook-associated protein FlgK, partial [Selenomonadaceae bacterium]|nr:flagellar hook-associated protein FlgK [Selenomonadaceae bacterium]
MRSTFTGLNTMVRGILANQLSLDTVGHNITNASTDGYSRQNVNLAATRGEARGSLYGDILVGTGVDAMSITRARSIYADRQFWSETATQEYYDVMQQNYEKLETIFDDSDQDGIQNAMHRFWETWQTLSANSSDDYARRNVISQAELMVNMIRTAADEMQVQMEHELDEIGMRV